MKTYNYQINYLDNLICDHELIEKSLLLFEKEIEKGEKINLDFCTTIIDFLIDYGDNCHNQKEELFYFPLLLEKGLPPMGPIHVMLEEHKYERNYLSEIKTILESSEFTTETSNKIKKLFSEFAEITKNHIWKENDILYPMGEKILDNKDKEYLINTFNKFSFEKYGQDAYKRFKSMIDSFEKKTDNKVNLLASLPYDVISNILDSLPVELSFVDENDIVRYFSHQNKKKIFHRSLGVIGRAVQKCHPEKSVHLVNKILEEMKAGTRDSAEFWINFQDKFVYISYFAVRNENNEYQGCVEMVQDIKHYRELEGEKRLL